MRTFLSGILMLSISVGAFAQNAHGYYEQIQNGSKTPMSSGDFRTLEEKASKDFLNPNHFLALSDAFAQTSEKVWSIVYGEVYWNLAPPPEPSNKISRRMVGQLQKSITRNGASLAISITKVTEATNAKLKEGQLPFENNYEMSFLLAVALREIDPHPFTLASLHQVRQTQLEIWVERKLALNEFMKHLLAIQAAGHLEAYDYDLFTSAFPEEAAAWKSTHSKQMDAYRNHALGHPFKPASNDFLRVQEAVPENPGKAGLGPWRFEMTRDQVKAQKEFGPYYDFKNADIGTQNGFLGMSRYPVSFYFENDKLVRIRVQLHMGPGFDSARKAWEVAFRHLESTFGGVEIQSIQTGALELKAVMGALDQSGLSTAASGRIQMGALPMPKEANVWSSFTVVEPGSFMVAVNFAKP